jgi:hypothetical protein
MRRPLNPPLTDPQVLCSSFLVNQRKAAIHIGANATNQLQVIARGQFITLLVHGTPVGQATLSTFASGIVGLRGINDGEVVFQQLSIALVSMQPEAALP